MEETRLREIAAGAENRLDLWAKILAEADVRTMAEVGVYKGRFAEQMLDRVPDIARYYLLDPWRHLDDWNKPANADDARFEAIHSEAMQRTEPYADKRVVLRGRTVEVVEQIPDGSLDLAYIDGDHTLRGITVDLARLRPKIRPGGFLAGDDLCRSIFQHAGSYEPTLVFPYALYFAEAFDLRVYALPRKQFLMQDSCDGYAFVDLAGGYDRTTLLRQLDRGRGTKVIPDPAAQSTSVTKRAQRAVRRLVRSLNKIQTSDGNREAAVMTERRRRG